MNVLQNEHFTHFDENLFIEMEKLGKLGMYETDLENGTFVASPYFQRMFDLPPKEQYSVLDFQALVHPDDFNWVMQLYAGCIEHHRPFDCEYRCLVKEKVMYVRSRSKIVYDEQGKALKAIGIKQDITEQKVAEQEKEAFTYELIKNREATSTIAHDLRSPISTIISIANLLKGHVSDERSYFLDQIYVLCNQATAIIEDVLELNRVEQQDFMLKTSLQPLAPIIHLVVNSLQPKAQEKNIRFVLADGQAVAKVDARRVQRILMNILSNAIKFSYKDSTVEVRLYEKKDQAVIEVQDYGTGMDEEQQKHLFEKFSKARRTGTQGEPTVGLGMSIAKKLVMLHKGQISVQSKAGRGTTVKLAFPKTA